MNGLKRAAVSCILTNGNHLLLLKRNKSPHIGKFLPVGGKIEPYETAQDAVIREVLEETGFVIDTPIYYGSLIESSPLDHYNWISFIFAHEIPMADPPYCDEGELVWVSAQDLDQLDIPPTDLPIYKAVLSKNIFAYEATF
nr:NUDIX domain-containing protein [Saprospiraceae bacterium]